MICVNCHQKALVSIPKGRDRNDYLITYTCDYCECRGNWFHNDDIAFDLEKEKREMEKETEQLTEQEKELQESLKKNDELWRRTQRGYMS